MPSQIYICDLVHGSRLELFYIELHCYFLCYQFMKIVSSLILMFFSKHLFLFHLIFKEQFYLKYFYQLDFETLPLCSVKNQMLHIFFIKQNIVQYKLNQWCKGSQYCTQRQTYNLLLWLLLFQNSKNAHIPLIVL